MKENFDKIFDMVLHIEGGYSKHPKDKGGATNMGITLETLQHAHEDFDYGDFNDDGIINEKDIILLDTKEEALPIYRKYFWDKVKGDDFPSGLDLLMFDFGVNSGPKNAIKILQTSLNKLGKVLDCDGVLGPRTLAQAQIAPRRLLVKEMLNERRIFYDRIVANKPDQNVFWKGWMNRVTQLEKDVQEFV
jgi:lysozyme family protein